MIHKRLTNLSLLVICCFSLTACPTERFRHEKYECNSGAFGISEIIFNDTSVGDIQNYRLWHRKKCETCHQKSTITTQMEDVNLRIDRDTGTVRVKRGKHYAVIACSKSVFTM